MKHIGFLAATVLIILQGCAGVLEQFETSSTGRSAEMEHDARIANVNASREVTYTVALSTIQEYGFPVESASETGVIVTGWANAPILGGGGEWKVTITIGPTCNGSMLSLVGTHRETGWDGTMQVKTIGRWDSYLLDKLEKIKNTIKRRAEGH
ncbi:MAG: hypothetical protein AB1393_10810 [Candidatus Edwardsbacteria bacterium]